MFCSSCLYPSSRLDITLLNDCSLEITYLVTCPTCPKAELATLMYPYHLHPVKVPSPGHVTSCSSIAYAPLKPDTTYILHLIILLLIPIQCITGLVLQAFSHCLFLEFSFLPLFLFQPNLRILSNF